MQKPSGKRGRNTRKKPPDLKAEQTVAPPQRQRFLIAKPFNEWMKEAAMLREAQMANGTWVDEPDPLWP